MQSKQAVDQGQQDEQAIRAAVNTWLEASKKGDSNTLLSLLADDVIFITPGREPFGKEAFRGHDDEMKNVEMAANIDIKEIEVAGDWAWMRSYLEVTFTSADGKATPHAGHILTIFEKQPHGWVIKRDANFVQPQNAEGKP